MATLELTQANCQVVQNLAQPVLKRCLFTAKRTRKIATDCLVFVSLQCISQKAAKNEREQTRLAAPLFSQSRADVYFMAASELETWRCIKHASICVQERTSSFLHAKHFLHKKANTVGSQKHSTWK